jgi:hypothetical protein
MSIRFASIILTLFLSSLAAAGESVTLVSGEKLAVTSAHVEGTTVVLEHPILGTLAIPAGSVQSINNKPLGTPSGNGSNAAPAKDEANPRDAQKAPEAPKQKAPSDWKGTFILAGSINEGTSQNANLFTQLTFARDTAAQTTTISTFYRFSSSQGETNQNWYNLTANQLWKILNSKWGIYASGEFDWSEFNTWEQRIAAHAGGQYRLVDLSRETSPALWVNTLQLDGRIGAGPRKEFAGVQTALVAEGELGGILKIGMGNKQSLEADASYYPTLDKDMEYRFNANVNWKIPMQLEGMDGLSLALGLKYQFQSDVSPGNKDYELLGTVGVSWDF